MMKTEFGDGQLYRRILDLIWETLTVKDAKVNFDSQLGVSPLRREWISSLNATQASMAG
jgi:uncharacterized protein YjaG (DUF416 family)